MDKLFEQFISPNDGTSLLKADIDKFNEQITEAKNKNYTREFVKELEDGLSDAVIKRYEQYRQSELTRLGKDIEDIKSDWNKKMVQSDAAMKKVSLIEKDYQMFTDEEIVDKFNSYTRMEITDPHQQQVLARELQKRGLKTESKHFRKHYLERQDDQPWKRLNPTLFERHENLSKLKYGEALGHIGGKNMKGVEVITPRFYSIRDLLK
jgi:hypothetical protein